MKFKQTLIAAAAVCALDRLRRRDTPQPMEFHHHGGGEGMEILHALNLTDAQKAQVHEAEHAAWSIRPSRSWREMHKVRARPDGHRADRCRCRHGRTSLRPSRRRKSSCARQLDQIHLNTVLQIRNLLTPEQVAQAASMHAKLAALHEQEHEVMGHEE